ncbi:hypothetical protein SLEP1_g6712 [Rubroshorea leprosula]|uniref:Uncharacterized protein n=1 Tax=Rubroshorea leprosula TaxID=152421 RepID=A0AAV5I620_9ROSI|nr:hypothetical protein SLEP1_g6712 [Rubroshorea leprosula]
MFPPEINFKLHLHFRVSAHFLLPCTEQAFSQAQPPPPTPLEKLISCLLPPSATGCCWSEFRFSCSPPRSRHPPLPPAPIVLLVGFSGMWQLF